MTAEIGRFHCENSQMGARGTASRALAFLLQSDASLASSDATFQSRSQNGRIGNRAARAPYMEVQVKRTILLGALLVTSLAVPASAQTAADPNPGAITLTTGVDFPSVYFFRGIRQEADPKFTMFPYGDVG